MPLAKSDTLKARLEREAKEKLVSKAAARYLELQKGPKESQKSIQAVIDEIQKEFTQETGKIIKLSATTVYNRATGRTKPKTESAAERSWLNAEETKLVIDFTIESAQAGFPLDEEHIRKYVNEICRRRHGEKFPADGVGKNWVDRFIERNHDTLKKYMSRPLDRKRGQGANPTTNAGWFKILGETIEKYDIQEDLIYACDESGFMIGQHKRRKVFGPTGQKIQHEQFGENRENITVLPCICADGTSLPPLVIFKGDQFMVKWKDNDPLQATLGRSKKGWTSGEICAGWLEIFDKQTRQKANGRARLLLVDGHKSHFTLELLAYARANNIHILCYPAHSTHIYQGLDVVCFAPLKNFYDKERKKFEQANGRRVEKADFLAVYGAAHISAFIPSTIKSAFRATGVWPFNPSAISEDQLKPSRATSNTNELPLPHEMTPIRKIAKLFRTMRIASESAESSLAGSVQTSEASSIRTSRSGSPLHLSSQDHDIPIDPVLLRETLETVSETVNTTLATGSQIPSPIFRSPSPTPAFDPSLLSLKPQTATERRMKDGLQAAHLKLNRQGNLIDGLYAKSVLHEGYLAEMNVRLKAVEEKAKDKGKGKETLRTGGEAVILTSDDFFGRVDKQREDLGQAEREKAERKEDRTAHAIAMGAWKAKDRLRVEENNRRRALHKKAVEKWNTDKETAKSSGLPFKVPKPKLGPLVAATSKPVRLYPRAPPAAQPIATGSGNRGTTGGRTRAAQSIPQRVATQPQTILEEEEEDFTAQINLNSPEFSEESSESSGSQTGSDSSGEDEENSSDGD